MTPLAVASQKLLAQPVGAPVEQAQSLFRWGLLRMCLECTIQPCISVHSLICVGPQLEVYPSMENELPTGCEWADGCILKHLDTYMQAAVYHCCDCSLQ